MTKQFFSIQSLDSINIQLHQQFKRQFLNSSSMNTNKFITKLIEMMKEYPQIINWSEDGQEMEIFDIIKFQTQVHPNYFASTNYQSFLRQLNMYSFKKMSKKKNSVCFRHLLFKKGNESEFQHINRRQRESTKKNLHQIMPNEDLQIEQMKSDNREEKINSLRTTISQLPSSIKSTINLIKDQIPIKKLYLVQRLERLLCECQNEEPQQSGKANKSLIEYASFSLLEERLKNRHSISSIQLEQSIQRERIFME